MLFSFLWTIIVVDLSCCWWWYQFLIFLETHCSVEDAKTPPMCSETSTTFCAGLHLVYMFMFILLVLAIFRLAHRYRSPYQVDSKKMENASENIFLTCNLVCLILSGAAQSYFFQFLFFLSSLSKCLQRENPELNLTSVQN